MWSKINDKTQTDAKECDVTYLLGLERKRAF